jgi:hypothetical protein
MITFSIKATLVAGLLPIAAISASSAAEAVGGVTATAAMRTVEVARPGDTPWG